MVDFKCICPIGTYDNDTHCANCSPGYFGNSTGLTSNYCSGPCLIGHYGSGGSTSFFCDGKCSLGHYCIEASPSSTQFLCNSGYFGNSTGLTSAICSGICNDGYYCPAGSSSANEFPCLAGYAHCIFILIILAVLA